MIMYIDIFANVVLKCHNELYKMDTVALLSKYFLSESSVHIPQNTPSSKKPLLHSHWKLPPVLMHRPLLGQDLFRHSSISSKANSQS